MYSSLRIPLVSVIAFASSAYATISTQCPSTDVCFSLNIPDATLSSGNGGIYLQLTGPTTYSYISVAQGTGMAGAHFFVMYTSADGTNVTVSPRLASGEVLPSYTSDTELELLEGSGVENGRMTANIKCSNCNSWSGGSMNLSSSSTSWIWARYTGDPLNTDDMSAVIRQHDDFGSLTFDASAQGGSSTNPFLTSSTDGATDTNTTSSSGGTTSSSGVSSSRATVWTVHAVLACFAWAAIFPIGGILIRLFSFPKLLWVHAGLQIAGLCVYTAAVGVGLQNGSSHLNDKHVIIGLILFAILFVQSLSGYLHHVLFKKNFSRTMWSYIHLWIGRAAITIGIINAGFGFQLMGTEISSWRVILYTVCAVVVWVTYVGSIVIGEMRRARTNSKHSVVKPGSGVSSNSDTTVEKQHGRRDDMAA